MGVPLGQGFTCNSDADVYHNIVLFIVFQCNGPHHWCNSSRFYQKTIFISLLLVLQSYLWAKCCLAIFRLKGEKNKLLLLRCPEPCLPSKSFSTLIRDIQRDFCIFSRHTGISVDVADLIQIPLGGWVWDCTFKDAQTTLSPLRTLKTKLIKREP